MSAPPGPRGRRGVSGWLALARLARNPLERLNSLFGRYGPVVNLGGGVPVFSSDPMCRGTVFAFGSDVLVQIENEPATFNRTPLSGTLYPRPGRAVGRRAALLEWATGLFALNGEEHRRQRRLMASAFVPRRHADYAERISRIADVAIEKVKRRDVADIHSVVGDITLRVATEIFFGEQVGRDSRIAAAGEQSLRMVLSPGVVALPFDVPGLPYRRFLSSVCAFNQEMRRLVGERRAEGAAGPDVLSGLVRAESDYSLSESEIVGHATVLFAAGHETSSNAISWVLFFLSQYQGWQEDVRSEIEAVLRGGPPSLASLERLELLEWTILESLRLMPPAPWNSRTTTRSCLVRECEIPAHTEVVGSIFHTHRDPREWSRADEFVPARWGEPDVPRHAFHPFGGGSRVCIGASFAMLEMKLILSSFLQKVQLDLVEGAQVDPLVNITMTFQSGLPMTVRSAGARGVRGRPRGRVSRLVKLPD